MSYTSLYIGMYCAWTLILFLPMELKFVVFQPFNKYKMIIGLIAIILISMLIIKGEFN
jgi:hypothetical protein